MKLRVFVTGGTGFVGGHLLSQIDPDWAVFASYRSLKYPFPNVQWVQVDLTDFENVQRLLQEISPDVILHAAALANLDAVAADPAKGDLVNFQVTQNLAEFTEMNRKRLIFVSSDMVFDGTKGMYCETDTPHPINYYGETKLTTERWLQENCSNFVVARSALVYGVSLTASHSFSEVMVRNWREEKTVSLFADQFRSPVLVNNLAQALLELAKSGFTGVLHLGGSERLSRLEFGIEFANFLSIRANLIKPTSMNAVKSRVLRPADTSFNISLAQQILSTNLFDCREGIQFLLQNYQF